MAPGSIAINGATAELYYSLMRQSRVAGCGNLVWISYLDVWLAVGRCDRVGKVSASCNAIRCRVFLRQIQVCSDFADNTSQLEEMGEGMRLSLTERLPRLLPG